MGNKNPEITEIIDKVDPFRNQRITYWAKRNGPPVVQIIDRLQNPVKKPLFLLVNYLDNAWPVSFGPLSDPSVFEVIYLVQYFGGFIYFSSHATKKRSKNAATLHLTFHNLSLFPFFFFFFLSSPPSNTQCSVATVQTGVFANLSNKIAKITGKFENVDEAEN